MPKVLHTPEGVLGVLDGPEGFPGGLYTPEGVLEALYTPQDVRGVLYKPRGCAGGTVHEGVPERAPEGVPEGVPGWGLLSTVLATYTVLTPAQALWLSLGGAGPGDVCAIRGAAGGGGALQPLHWVCQRQDGHHCHPGGRRPGQAGTFEEPSRDLSGNRSLDKNPNR